MHSELVKIAKCKVNLEYVETKVKDRLDKIKTSGFLPWEYDNTLPQTTNKKMLKEAGYHIKSVTKDNVHEIIFNLSFIGVRCVGYNHLSMPALVREVRKCINESVNAIWGWLDVEDVIDFTACRNSKRKKENVNG